MQQWTASAALLIVLGAALLIYWPGLGSPLLLDDIPNLQRLEAVGPINDKASFLQFVFHKSNFYPVRPLSFASFVLNDVDWPLYVPMHKYTNILFHLLNGVLVFWLSLLLCRIAKISSQKTTLVTTTATALWLLAPLQVSTVLYVIQRMTELSALFVLGGLITYCYGRLRLERHPTWALVQMSCGIVVFGLLGFLAKQNAILLTLFVLVAEYTLFRFHLPIQDKNVRLYYLVWKWLFLVTPVVLAFAAIVAQGVIGVYQYRPFTVSERILTQARVLFDYLHNLLIPARSGLGLAHDDFVLSTGVFSPVTTLLSIVGLLGLLAAALWSSRHAASPFAFAVLWFLSGHLLESTVIPLEIYWEHRNYLPAFGPVFAIAYYVWTLRLPMSRLIQTGFALYVLAFPVVTQQTVDTWSNKLLLGELWASEHPRSIRAQQIRADYWTRLGYYGKANEILERTAELRPGAMGTQVQVLLTTCRHAPEELPATFSEVEPRIKNAYFDHSVAPTIKLLTEQSAKICPQLTTEHLLRLIDAVLDNDSIAERDTLAANLLALRASVLSKTQNPQVVVSNLYAAFDRWPSYEVGLVAVRYLYDIGQYKVALRVLDEVSTLETTFWSFERFKQDQLATWRNRINEALESNT